MHWLLKENLFVPKSTFLVKDAALSLFATPYGFISGWKSEIMSVFPFYRLFIRGTAMASVLQRGHFVATAAY